MKPAINIQPRAPGEADCTRVIETDRSASELFCTDLVRLIQAINEAPVQENEKQDAKAKLMDFLTTPGATAVLRDSIPHLRALMGF